MIRGVRRLVGSLLSGARLAARLAALAAAGLIATPSIAAPQSIDLSDPIVIESGFEYADWEIGGIPCASIGFDDQGALAFFSGPNSSLLFARRLTPDGAPFGDMVQLDTNAEFEFDLHNVQVSDFDGTSWKVAMRRRDLADRLEVVVRSYWLDEPHPVAELVVSTDSWGPGGAARIGWTGSVHVIAWTAMDSTLRIARVDRELRRVGEEQVVADVDPRRACALSRDGRWVGWRTPTGMLRVQRLDDRGERIGTHVDVVQSLFGETLALASDGETALAAWPTQPGARLAIAWIDPDGTVELQSAPGEVSAEGGVACALSGDIGAVACTDGESVQVTRFERGGIDGGPVSMEIGPVASACHGGLDLVGLDCEWLGRSFAAITADGLCYPGGLEEQGDCYSLAAPQVLLTPIPRLGEIAPREAVLLNGLGKTSAAHFFPAPGGFQSLSLDLRSSEYLHVTRFDASGGVSGQTVRFPTSAVSDDRCRGGGVIGSRARVWDDLPSLLMLRSERRVSDWFIHHQLLLDLVRVDGNAHPFWRRTWVIAEAYDSPRWSCNGFDFEPRGSRFLLAYGLTPRDSLAANPAVHVRLEDTRASTPIQRWSFRSNDDIAAPTLGWAGESPLVAWMQRIDSRWRLVTWSPSYVGPELETGRTLALGDGEQTAPDLIRGPGGFLCVYREIPVEGTAPSAGSSIRAIRLSAEGHLLGAPTQVSTLPGMHIAPIGVWNGAAYIVDWFETPSRTVYGQRLDATGVPSSPQEFVLADSVVRRGARAASSDGTVALPYDDHFRLLFDTLAPALPAAPSLSAVDGAIRIEWQAPSDVVHAGLFRARFDGDVIPAPPVGYDVIAEREGSGGPQVTVDQDVVAGDQYAYAVGFEGPSGETKFGPAMSIVVGAGAGDGVDPTRFQLTALSAPGRGAVRFRLVVPAPGGRPTVRVFSPAGRLVREWGDQFRSVGVHQLDWDGRDAAGRLVASGVYFVRAELGPDRVAARAVLLR